MATETREGFRISGEAMTRIARGLVLDGDWARASRFLVGGLAGCEYGHAFQVLSGGHCLAGDETSGLTLEPDSDAREYQGEVEYFSAGVVSDGHRWWRPYAHVTSFGRRDALGSIKNEDTLVGVPVELPGLSDIAYQRWATGRVLYYANNPNADRVVRITGAGKTAVNPLGVYSTLWEQTTMPPPWLPVLEGVDKWQRGWDRAWAAGKISERGAQSDPAQLAEWKTAELDRAEASASGAFKAAEEIGDALEADPVHPLVRSETLREEYGVIDPAGAFWTCERTHHDDLCAAMFPDAANGKAEAEARGCIFVHDLLGASEPMLTAYRTPTGSARNTAYNWARVNGWKFQRIFRDWQREHIG